LWAIFIDKSLSLRLHDGARQGTSLQRRRRSKIKIDFDSLPFVIDPLDTLRPGGPNPRIEGNVWPRQSAEKHSVEQNDSHQLGLESKCQNQLAVQEGDAAGVKSLRVPEKIFALCVLCVLGMRIGTVVGLAQSNDLGIFTNESSVGATPPGVKAQYDPAKGEYRITGGGANMWNAVDAFYFVWKKASGDMSLTADVRWVGTSSTEHRKAVLMFRQSLDPGSAYADAASHGDGLTSLQFRGAANEQTYQIPSQADGPVRLRIERKQSRFTIYAGKPGEELKPIGLVEYVGLKDPVLVGLGVCSHVATTLETAVFSNVKLEEAVATK
jgi:hypothetical protein